VYSLCIPKFKIGDGFQDCYDGEDEINVYQITAVMIAVPCAFIASLIIVGAAYVYSKIKRLKVSSFVLRLLLLPINHPLF